MKQGHDGEGVYRPKLDDQASRSLNSQFVASNYTKQFKLRYELNHKTKGLASLLEEYISICY